MARGSDIKEIKNKHTSRPVGGAETGTWVERTPEAVADRDGLAECGMNRAGRPRTSRPCGPDKRRGPDSVVENGAGRAAGSTPWPHIRTQINQTNGGS